jgi:hypothetical protein
MIKQLALDVLMVSIVMFVNLPACVWSPVEACFSTENHKSGLQANVDLYDYLW